MIVIYSSVEVYEQDKRNCSLLRRILSLCEKYEGKDISKRIVTHLEKEMPEYRFSLLDDCLCVYPEKGTYDRIYLPHNKIWNREKIWNRSAGSMGFYAEQRIRQYEAYLTSETKMEIDRREKEILELMEKIRNLENEQTELLEIFKNNNQ